jgi:hypothetical protein
MQRSHQTCVEQLLRRFVFFCLTLLLVACGDDNGIHVKIKNLGDKTSAPLTNLALVVADAKHEWSAIESGETLSVTVRADPNSEREVVLIYTHAGKQKSWDGPILGMGRQGYRFILEIDADGNVTSRYCALPCSLDE